MSKWKEIPDVNVELSDDVKTVEILYETDDFGNNYIEISTEHVIKILKKQIDNEL
jgi:hypothetical protein